VKVKRIVAVMVYALTLTVVANSFLWLNKSRMILFLTLFMVMSLLAGSFILRLRSFRLWACHHGAILLTAFIPSALISVAYHLVLAAMTIPADYMVFLKSAAYCICVEAILFWDGMLCIYLASYQLGVKQRLVAAVCGMIPVLNLIVLQKMLRTVFKEVEVEYGRQQMNLSRADQKLCATKYPLMMVHGICFRDFKLFNYWGRIPAELKANGAEVHYGNHHSATSVKDSAQELTDRIKKLCKHTGCEKVNIIAHSKGGLDCRYALEKCGLAPYVASLTTVNTPHRGCQYADYLLENIEQQTQQKVGRAYNFAMKRVGDKNPDLLAAVKDLTYEACAAFNEQIGDPEGIFCQSVGSVLKNAASAKFPMNFSYHLVKLFDGPNDGLVSEPSFRWGEKYTLVEPTGEEGISHADIIDLSRMDVEGFDVREFYVGLINDLKNRGL